MSVDERAKQPVTWHGEERPAKRVDAPERDASPPDES
jgi:nitrilase